MALKKEKTASGGEVGEVSKKPSFRDRYLEDKKRLIFFGIIIIMVVFVAIFLYQENRSSNDYKMSCNSDASLVSEVHKNTISGKITGNKDDDISKILSKDGVEKSPNCLFVISEYYATIFDIRESEKYYNLFVVSDLNDFSVKLFPDVYQKPSEYLTKKIEFAKVHKKQIVDGFHGIGENN